jgi:3-deoxy-7-phosphoheptulonate synthase
MSTRTPAKPGTTLITAREQVPEGTMVRVGDVTLGGSRIVVIAGPCSVEDETQVVTTARAVKAAGASLLRGGAYKPRTSPYSFQGLRREGLEILARAREATGLGIVTEVMDARHLEDVARVADVLQVGSRNMQNFTLLDEVGTCGKPILLKRGMSATLEEFLFAAERVALGGNAQIILCERGIRTFETATRNTLDLNAVPFLKRRTHLPVIVDPSHGDGSSHGARRRRRRQRRSHRRGASTSRGGAQRWRAVAAPQRIPEIDGHGASCGTGGREDTVR